MFVLLRNRRVMQLGVGSMCNNIGNWCALVAIMGIASERFHASGLVFAALGVSWSLPRALLGPMPGRLVDRFGPKRVLPVGYVLDALVCLAFIAAGSVPALLALGFVHGMIFSFTLPAEGALPPQVVEPDQLASVNSVMALSQQSSTMVGPAIAAVLLASGGGVLAMAVNVGSYVVALACVLPLPLRDVRARDRARAREAVHHVRKHAELRLLFVVVLAQSAAFAALGSLEPLYARDVLGGGSGTYAALQVPFGIGIVIGTLWGLRRGHRRLRLGSIAAHLGAGGVAAAVSVATASLAVSLVAFAFLGFAAAGTFQPAKSAMQLRTPESMHGRLLALLLAMVAWAEVPARSATGALTARIGVPILGVGFGCLMVSAALVVLVGARRSRAREDHSRVGVVVAFPPRQAPALRAA